MEEETINKEDIDLIQSPSMIEKIKRKIKKKKKSNFKGLKDLLNNITPDKGINTKVKKKKIKKNKKNKKNKEKEQQCDNTIFNKEMLDKKNDIDINCFTNISSKSQYENNFLNEKSQKEYTISENVDEFIKNKYLNFIPKANEEIGKNQLNNKEDDNIIKVSSPILKYYEGSEEYLKKMNSYIMNFSNSINFVSKKAFSSSEFKFNNNKFIKNNNKDINIKCNNSSNLNFINLNIIKNSDCKYNFGFNNNNYNTFYFYNNLNINLFYNNIYLNNENDKEKKNHQNKFDFSEKYTNDNLEELKSINSNNKINLNNYIIQNAFSLNEKNSENSSNSKEELLKIFENININSNDNIANFYPNKVDFINNNIYNKDNCNISNYINNEFYQKMKNNKNNSNCTTNETSKKTPFCRRPNDWICGKCYNLNFGFRIYCNRCSAPKDVCILKNN